MIDIINDNFNDLAKDYYKLQEEYEQLQQENKQLKNILTELEEWLKTVVEYETLHKSGYMTVRGEWGEEVLDKIQELKEKYK